MFERQRAVLHAAGVGYLLSGFLLALTAGSAYYVAHRDPFRLVPDWDQVLTQRAAYIGVGLFGGLVTFVAALAALVLFLALAARAERLHPTSATLGGVFLTAGLLALAVLGVRMAVVVPYAALQYRAAASELHKHALLMEAYTGEHLFMLGFWCFLGFTAPGLYFLGRAFREERGWLPDAMKLAAALILLHLPMTLYLAQASLLEGRYVRGLAVLDQVLLWGSLALVAYLSARWLRALGRSLAP